MIIFLFKKTDVYFKYKDYTNNELREECNKFGIEHNGIKLKIDLIKYINNLL